MKPDPERSFEGGCCPPPEDVVASVLDAEANVGAHCLLAAKRLDIPVDPALLARVMRGIGKLAGEKPDDYYSAYFYASALSEVDPATYGKAMAATRSTVVAQQQATGDNAGTWPANDDRWGSAGGQLYSTPMAMLALMPR